MKFLFLFFAFILFTFGVTPQDKLTPEMLWKLNRLSGAQVNPNESQLLYGVRSYDAKSSASVQKIFLYDLKKKQEKIFFDGQSSVIHPQWLNDNEVVFMSKEDGANLLLTKNLNGEQKQLVNFGGQNILDFMVSPNGNYLVTLQKVKVRESFQERHSDLPDADYKVYDELMFRHWDTYQDEFETQIFLHALGTDDKFKDKGINILKGEVYSGIVPPFHGLDNVTFSPDEEQLLYVSKKMSKDDFSVSTDSQVYAYHILNGETKLLTPGYKGYDMNPAFDKKGEYLAWLSMEKDGFEADKNDIIVRSLSDGKDFNLTRKFDLTVNNFKWAPDGKSIFFIATIEATNQIFSIDLKKQELTQITDGIFNYNDFDFAGKFLVGTRQSMLVPNDLYLVNLKNGEAEQITDVNDEILNELSKPTIEKRWVKTTDNKKMLTWVILPPNFDENKKYPTLLYCQGGPQSAVSQFFSYRWNFRLMAEQGYVVIAPNRRGLPGFGQAWNDAISQDWGGQAMRDYLAAVDEIKQEEYIDEKRIGAIGASYGGYSVYYLAGIHEGRFKSFISHCGLFNMESWYASTEELFFANWELGGPYWDPKYKEGIVKNSPHTNVGKWDTPILVIHGGKDYRVPENQGFEAYQAAKMKGIKSRLLYFPDENHWVLQPQNGIVWHREFFGWLAETLK